MLNIGNSTRFRLGDKVTVVVDDNCGYGKGHRGTITGVREDCGYGVVYEVDGKHEYTEEELELTPISFDHSKMNLEIKIPNEVPKSIPKLNTASKVEINDDNEIKSQSEHDFETIAELRIKVASLESELLTVYRELHRQNKDS